MDAQYSLLFLGNQTFKRTLWLEDATDCWQQVTIALHARLKALRHVQYSFRDNLPQRGGFYDGLPKVDAVLFWGVPQTWMSYDHKRLRRATRCRAVITVCERPLAANADWRFAFRGEEAPSTTRVDAPADTGLYRRCAKQAGSVLIDHWDQDTPSDWTHQIEAWLQDTRHGFDISRCAGTRRLQTAKLDDTAEVREIAHLPFARWLAATERMETFVMTHRESYGYAALDMFAREIRVLCPTPFVPAHFKDRFHIDAFSTQKELVTLLRKRPDPLRLTMNRQCLTDYSDLVRLIDQRFQILLRAESFKRPSRAVARLWA